MDALFVQFLRRVFAPGLCTFRERRTATVLYLNDGCLVGAVCLVSLEVGSVVSSEVLVSANSVREYSLNELDFDEVVDFRASDENVVAYSSFNKD